MPFLNEEIRNGVGGYFYVISGRGKAIISGETADIKEGDAIPLLLNDTKQFENTGTDPLQLINVGIVSDMNRRNEILNSVGWMRGLGGAPRGGGAGRGSGRNAAPAASSGRIGRGL